MKRATPLLFLLAVLSVISGYLMSKASWIGRVGMTFFYKEYNLLKVWWQGAIAIFIVLMVLFVVHSLIHLRFIQLKLATIISRLVHFLILLLAIAGLYFTYDDFSNNLSHRLLGWHFHYGIYLFWIGWILICLFFMLKKTSPTDFPIDPNNKEKVTV